MPMTDAATNLHFLIRARQAVIAIASAEEERVQNAVLTIAEKQKTTVLPPPGSDEAPKKFNSKALVTWTVSDGLKLVRGHQLPLLSSSKPEEQALLLEDFSKKSRQAIPALRFIRDWSTNTGSDQPTLFLFKDLNLQLNGLGSSELPADDDAITIARLLRDIAQEFPNGNHTLILLGADLHVPAALDKDVAFIDWPLPTPAELRAILDEAREDAGVEVELSEAEADQIVRSLQGLTATDATNALAYAMAVNRRLDASAEQHIIEMKSALIKKTGLVDYYPPDPQAVGGLDNFKQFIDDAHASFTSEAAAYGRQPERAVLFAGVPGVGKSKSAKAAAKGRMPILGVNFGALKSSLVGDSVANLRRVLKLADAMGECIFWWDEIDTSMGDAPGEIDGGVKSEMLGVLLTWMQEHTSKAFPFATTNHPERLPASLLRRFSAIYFADVPPARDRAEIWDIQLREHRQDPGRFDLDDLVEQTAGYTGEEIRKIVDAALAVGFREGQRPITTEDLINAIPTVQPISVTASEHVAAMREWAAGRAKAASLPDVPPAAREVKPPPSKGGRRKVEHDD